MKRIPVWALWLFLASLATGCKVKEGRVQHEVPAGISIPVLVDGRPSGTLDTAWLRQRPADFSDGPERRAWRVSAFLDDPQDGSDRVIEVESEGGARMELRPTEAREVAVVTFNRAGHVMVKLLDPSDPFPAFHGRGGNRGRPADPEQVRAPKAIHVRTAALP